MGLFGGKKQMSEEGIDALKRFEGSVKKRGVHVVYKDSGGAPTIGYGHLLTKSERTTNTITINGEEVDYTNGLTEEQAEELLAQDVDWAERCVRENTKVNLDQCQFDALVSFVFNVGCGAYRSSTLLERLNSKEFEDVPNQLMRWVYDNGKKVDGLINRREKEVAVWNGRYQTV